ncbi:hypothetical protein TNCV_1820081 [Trichonephila clavipes]|nr:hypothetical protein TNCV_1820081 [Trichonephila clavipes]
MFPPSSFVNPMPLAHTDTPRDNDPKGGSQYVDKKYCIHSNLSHVFFPNVNDTYNQLFLESKAEKLVGWEKTKPIMTVRSCTRPCMYTGVKKKISIIELTTVSARGNTKQKFTLQFKIIGKYTGVQKLAYQLNEEAERKERPIREIRSKVMYGSTCADMQVDVMGECLSSITAYVVGDDIWMETEVESLGSGRPQCADVCGCRVRNCFAARFTTLRTISKLQEQLISSVVVASLKRTSYPQMYMMQMVHCLKQPEETGGSDSGEIATRTQATDDRYRVLPWPEDCTVVVCLHVK